MAKKSIGTHLILFFFTNSKYLTMISTNYLESRNHTFDIPLQMLFHTLRSDLFSTPEFSYESERASKKANL